MSVCRNLKGYARRHGWVADSFSLTAAILFFGSLFFFFTYHDPIIDWILQDLLPHAALAVAALFVDFFLVFLFLNLGSARLADEDEGCFQTFRGRRAGQGSVGAMFSSMVHHIEQVGRKHR